MYTGTFFLSTLAGFAGKVLPSYGMSFLWKLWNFKVWAVDQKTLEFTWYIFPSGPLSALIQFLSARSLSARYMVGLLAPVHR